MLNACSNRLDMNEQVQINSTSRLPGSHEEPVGGLYDRPSISPPAKPRAIVYIDGFNFYYGAIKNGPYKWLNLERFFCLLLKDDDVICIRYFTSLVGGPRQNRQVAFLNALSTTPKVKVVLGKFKDKSVQCSHQGCQYTGDRVFKTPEEKRTDVGIAIQMVDDAYQDRCDRLILVSGDSDLVPAVTLVKNQFPKKRVIVYQPSRTDVDDRRADELRSCYLQGLEDAVAAAPDPPTEP